MTDKCGYEDTTTGHPCQNPAESCPWHNDDIPTPDGGRPTKLTEERQGTITTAIAEGKTITDAARMCGINRVTIYNWLERGESEDHGPFKDFFDAIERARGHRGDYYHSLALDLAIENGDHRFIMSLLKTMEPDVWGDTKTGVEAAQPIIELPDSVTEQWRSLPNQ